MSFEYVKQFEAEVSKFYGAPYAVATDSCTHAVELCLRYKNIDTIYVPEHTYISIPFLANKLNIKRVWKTEDWIDYYYLTDNIIDAAVLWKQNSYISNTFMCLSFQFQKHLSLGRGGMILCDNESDATELKKMSYDGRLPDLPWRDQNINSIGYHYYMTPETAKNGIDKISQAIDTSPRQWRVDDWPDLTQMDIFNNE